jgi:HTH-type transcriptional regulator, competence development regulator
MINLKMRFAETVRAERTRQGISLRELAKRLDITPTYLSKIERMEFAPPAEDKIKDTARILALDPDLLLAKAGKVDSDVLKIILDNRQVVAKFLRAAKRLSKTGIDDLQKQMDTILRKREANRCQSS